MRRYQKKSTSNSNTNYFILVLKIIIGPILVGLVLYIVKQCNTPSIEPPPKYGILQIQCNQDSADIFLNERSKGRTLSKKTVMIDSLLPGSYILIVEKFGFRSDTTLSVRINSGEITTAHIELKEIQKPPPPPPAIKINNNKITPVQLETEPMESKKLTIIISREVTNPAISIDEEEPYSVKNKDTILLPVGSHLILITYQNKLNESFKFSKRVNLSQDDTLFINKSDFKKE